MAVVEVVEQVTAAKRKRYNKNKKKAWRKKADITQVEQRLEDERREERYGGPLEERKDSEMMFVDLGDGGNEAVPLDLPTNEEFTLEYTLDEVPEGPEKVKLKPRKVKIKAPKLKSHQFLRGLPGARPPHKPRKKQGILTVKMKKKQELQSKDPRIIKKRKEAAKQTLQDLEIRTKRPKTIIKTDFSTDLWQAGNDKVTQECKKKGLEESFIGGISDYYRRQRRMKPIKVPKIRQVATSKLNAVALPHAGASYNPSYQSHQKLLMKAVKQEQKHLKSVRKIENATTKMFPTADKAPTHQTWMVEMLEGLPINNDDEEETQEPSDNHHKEEIKEATEEQEEEETDEEEEEEETDEAAEEGQETEEATEDQQEKECAEEASNSKPVAVATEKSVTVSCKPTTERKTKKMRRKEKRLKLQNLRRLKEKEERIRSSSIYKLKTFQKEIVQEEILAKKRTASRLALQEQRKSMTHRLGRMKFEEEEIAVHLGDELTDSLRRVKPAVELLEDRFKNFQRRNIIEPRVKHKLKMKFKPKVVMKRGHREELAKIEQMVEGGV